MIRLAIVTMLHSRRAEHLRWQLWSLQQQSIPVQAIVVCTGRDKRFIASVVRVCEKHRSWCDLRIIPQETLRRAWALNVGIQHVPEQIAYVACIDADFVFSANFCQVALELLSDGRSFVQCEPSSLGHGFPVRVLAGHWDGYMPTLRAGRKGQLQPGAFQAAPRDWWFKAHGYDERYVLDGMDNDVQMRANMSGMFTRWIPFDKAQALHQWHEMSLLKHAGADLIHEEGRNVMANPTGWGNL